MRRNAHPPWWTATSPWHRRTIRSTRRSAVTRASSKIAADFHHRLEADPQLGPYFRDIDAKQYQERLVIQFCEVSGGPCKQAKYEMRKIHSGMDINKATF